MRTRMHLIAPAAAIAAALLLTGCGDDEGGGGPGAGGLVSGGGSEGSGELPELPDPELELETTGGGIGGDSGGTAGGGGGGEAGWYAHWEANGVTLYTTPDGVLYGNSTTGEVCTQDVGLSGSLDWEPVLFSCEPSGFANVTLRLNGETMAIEWDQQTEEVTKVEDLTGQTVDLASLEATILN
ncbi:hypothetical protein ACTWP5_05130 [Streptomyces sp. 4N509B]|uniref:hypothetical protein n=1 Tax=Streptomyces sp. 4N509B TaxID=3457413 RepID=UPI003FD2536C